MRKYLIFFFMFCLAFASCKTESTYTIEGTLPNSNYDGEFIFLTPLVNATRERVDSTFISGGRFRFTGLAADSEMFVLRTRPILRFELQELLLVKEQGTTQVQIGSISSATGTPLNDSMQLWKDKLSSFDSLNYLLASQFEGADPDQKQKLITQSDSLKLEINRFNYQFVLNNQQNVVGKFVFQLRSSTFTSDQKEKLFLK